MITDFLISVVDLKISILKNIRRHLTGEAKMDKNYKRWRKDVKKWAEQNNKNEKMDTR
jgi:hypothetical protein|tara:strand:- start:295 stop:468 length:174 start_codon:yes stop_codon:yes gene_type:complete